MRDLQLLYCINNVIDEVVPGALEGLSKLAELEIQNNKLRRLPDELDGLSSLVCVGEAKIRRRALLQLSLT